MASDLDDLLDKYLAGDTGALIDPAAARAPSGEPDSREGQVIDVTGLAERAMEGALVVEDSGAALYVAGLDNWPVELYRKRVTVTGTLGRRRAGSVPGVSGGSAYHGSSGSSRVLSGATWKLAE